MIFSQYHESKTDDISVDETKEPELNSPSVHLLAAKCNFDMQKAFPAQEDDNDNEGKASLKKLKGLVTNLKGDTAPGKSGVDKHVLAWFIEYFPNIFLEAFNFLLANPDWESSVHSAYLKRRKIVFLPKKGKDPTCVKNYRPI